MLNILFDNQPTAGNYKTAKIPSLLNSIPNESDSYYLYIKTNKDYLFWDHNVQTKNEQYQLKSKIIVSSISFNPYCNQDSSLVLAL